MKNAFNLGDEVLDEDNQPYTVVGIRLPEEGQTPVYDLEDSRGVRCASREGLLSLRPQPVVVQLGCRPEVHLEVNLDDRTVRFLKVVSPGVGALWARDTSAPEKVAAAMQVALTARWREIELAL